MLKIEIKKPLCIAITHACNLFCWGCAPIAYLEMQYQKYKMSSGWGEYLNYKPLRIESTFKEKINFFKLEEEFICGMCPSKPNFIKRISRFKFGCDKELVELNINVKKYN
jgi:hypothetical protein